MLSARYVNLHLALGLGPMWLNRGARIEPERASRPKGSLRPEGGPAPKRASARLANLANPAQTAPVQTAPAPTAQSRPQPTLTFAAIRSGLHPKTLDKAARDARKKLDGQLREAKRKEQEELRERLGAAAPVSDAPIESRRPPFGGRDPAAPGAFDRGGESEGAQAGALFPAPEGFGPAPDGGGAPRANRSETARPGAGGEAPQREADDGADGPEAGLAALAAPLGAIDGQDADWLHCVNQLVYLRFNDFTGETAVILSLRPASASLGRQDETKEFDGFVNTLAQFFADRDPGAAWKTLDERKEYPDWPSAFDAIVQEESPDRAIILCSRLSRFAALSRNVELMRERFGAAPGDGRPAQPQTQTPTRAAGRAEPKMLFALHPNDYAAQPELKAQLWDALKGFYGLR